MTTILKPWREVIVPHKDVAEGRYQQAEFAADLAQVLSGNAELEYQDPSEFFSRTYLTEGMKLLLASSLRRACRINGDPVIELKTAFGGGKTHSMLAIYHLFKNKNKVKEHPKIKEVLSFVGVKEIPDSNVAVLVGTALDPAKPREIPELKCSIKTLWGEMAYQLGGKEGYNFIKESDQKSVAPGSNTLVQLFDNFGPCVILIDELSRYAGNIYSKNDLPAGSFDSIMTFIQNLTEAVKRSKSSMLIAAIPESNIEIGGEGGQAALTRIENIFGRLEVPWKPVKANEGFEIVRIRLFEPVKDEKSKNEVCSEFSKMYSSSSTDFPNECKEASYLKRLKEAYPFHPEIFDRLYSDWSSLEKFQRTRGVLRLMAATIHQLWISGDKALLIMPGSVPLDAPRVRDELTRYLSDEWNSIVDIDVDGEQSEPKKLDATNKRFGLNSAARRVARSIFLGSAPSAKEQKNRGIENVRIMLGVVQPNESLSTFHDALSSLAQKLTHLYSQGNRYWYDSQPNLRKTVEDRAGRLDKDEILVELNRRLHNIREKADFAGIHICPESEDVEDEPEVRLVVLPSTKPHKKNSSLSSAYYSAKEILEKRGTIPRQYKNMLVFIAADEDIMLGLEADVRYYLSWKSIIEDQEALNLDAHQRRQANDSVQKLEQTVSIRINEAYSWLLIPTQDGTKKIEIEAIKVTKGEGSFVQRASKQIRNEELLITKWSPALLRNELDKWLWKNEKNISLKKVWDCFASYPYLPRLKDSSVLIECIKEGLRTRDFFGYASSLDNKGKYLGLVIGKPGNNPLIDSLSVLVKPEQAIKQLEEEEKKIQGEGNKQAGYQKTDKEIIEQAKKEVFRRFNGTVRLDPTRLSRDAGQIAEEIIQHLASLPDSEVNISMEINANVPEGIPEKTVRTILENCKTLKFNLNDFEE